MMSSARAETLTLSDVVERALKQSTALEIQRRVIQEAEGVKMDVGLLPNPLLEYSREDLSQAGLSGGEWYAGTSMPMAFIWMRGPDKRAASTRIQAEMLAFNHLQDQIRFDVQKAFVEYHFMRQKHLVWQSVSALFASALKTGNLRHSEGDISKYEQQRIALEALRYARLEAESLAERNKYRRKLAFYLNAKTLEDHFETVLEDPNIEIEINLDVAIMGALAHRSDLKAFVAFVQASQEAVVAAKRKSISEANLAFGFKRQEDGFKGTVLKAEFGLPIFDRNQGKVKIAQSVFEQQRLTSTLLEKKVRVEVADAFDQYSLYAQQVKQFEKANVSPDSILDIARFAYEEGDMSLIEMFDGLQAYSEAFLSRLDVFQAYHMSRFGLEKAIGQSLSQLK